MSLKAKLTRIDEGATNETGIRQEVVIDDVTQLGRLASLTRETPGSSWWMRRYAKPRLAVQINDPTESLSANHAIIQPSQVEGGSFSIQDYGSTNGTFVNGNPVPRIPTGISSLWKNKRGYPLETGNVITMGNIQFYFALMDPAENPHHAVMIGHFGGNLKGTTPDVQDLKIELEQRGFLGNIDTLFNIEATRGKILRRLQLLSRKATQDSTFIFYFSGHGSKRGQLCLLFQTINAKDLFSALNGIRGRLLFILDGCHTESLIADAELPHGSDLIANKGTAFEGNAPSVILEPSPDFMDAIAENINTRRGYLTRAIVKMLRANPGSISATELVRQAQVDPRIMASSQRVVHHKNHLEGHTVVLDSRRR